MRTVASFRTLKRGNKKCGNEEVFQLVTNVIGSDITKEGFDRLLELLIENQSFKRNKIENWVLLCLPKEYVQHDKEMIE